MKKSMLILLILAGLLGLTCNRVPVRKLTFKVQVQELRKQGKAVKVDILWVIDDSGSMCQEQESLGKSFKSFMNALKTAGRIDPHIAVTTTNMCEKKLFIQGKWRDNPAAIMGRGKFLYHPATSFPAGCRQTMIQACQYNKDCEKNWSCKGADTGETVPLDQMYLCDNPKNSSGPKDLTLVTVNPKSYCVRHCDRVVQPLLCEGLFGESRTCADLCKKGPCTVSGCVAAGLGTDAECAKVCSITNTCEAKCAMFFKDTAKCGQVCSNCEAKCNQIFNDKTKCSQICGGPADQCFSTCDQNFTQCDQKFKGKNNDKKRVECYLKCDHVCGDCFTTCAGHYNQHREWLKGNFDKHDVECGVMCKADPTCDDLCAAQFGGRNVKCVYPGGGQAMSGCMKLPETSICPKSLDAKYNILDYDVVDEWVKKLNNGQWAGDPAWKDLKKDQVREKVFEQLFKCMATVGATQFPCANQEMGLRAAWQALDTTGEDADQAKAFLRDDAYLMVVIVSDEDDCSTDKLLTGNDATRCACLADQNGCLNQPDTKCDPGHAGPLIPVTSIVDRIKSLKPDPSMVLFAAITGEPLPDSDVTPLLAADENATLDRYYQCKCANGRNQTLNYICKSSQGLADFGSRYVLAAKCFHTHGVVSNICNDAGLEDALKDIVKRFSPIFARICLPRPMYLPKHPPKHMNEVLDVVRIDAAGKRTQSTYVKDCLGHEDANHYTLVKYSPGCPKIDVTSGDRLENAIGFCKALDPHDSVEITYRAASIGSSRSE